MGFSSSHKGTIELFCLCPTDVMQNGLFLFSVVEVSAFENGFSKVYVSEVSAAEGSATDRAEGNSNRPNQGKFFIAF